MGINTTLMGSSQFAVSRTPSLLIANSAEAITLQQRPTSPSGKASCITTTKCKNSLKNARRRGVEECFFLGGLFFLAVQFHGYTNDTITYP